MKDLEVNFQFSLPSVPLPMNALLQVDPRRLKQCAEARNFFAAQRTLHVSWQIRVEHMKFKWLVCDSCNSYLANG